jgi:hypothetical protein
MTPDCGSQVSEALVMEERVKNDGRRGMWWEGELIYMLN